MPDLATFRISHPTLGELKVIKRTGSVKLSARWINGRLRVNIPAYATENEIVRAIEQHKADFEAIRPKSPACGSTDQSAATTWPPP